MGQRKHLSPRQESNPWPPEHLAGALSTLSYENSWRAWSSIFNWVHICSQVVWDSCSTSNSNCIIFTGNWRWRGRQCRSHIQPQTCWRLCEVSISKTYYVDVDTVELPYYETMYANDSTFWNWARLRNKLFTVFHYSFYKTYIFSLVVTFLMADFRSARPPVR